MTMTAIVFGLVVMLAVTIEHTHGHGRLMDPAGRSSAWRLGFPTPRNYDDNALFCGGFATMQNSGGKCGVCGDPFNGRHDNEPPNGKYATGTIVRKYKRGGIIDTKAEITANHNGYMEYRICPHNDVHTPVTQECLDRYVLQRADGKGSRVTIPGGRTGYFDMKFVLPSNITCSQCVIQWKYHAGNSWGVDRETGKSGVGYGPQEEFYACADVSIDASDVVPLPTLPPAPVKTQPPIITRPPLPVITQKPVTRPPVVFTNPPATGPCHAINLWAGDPTLDRWCIDNCAIGKCPPYGCQCGDTPVITDKPTTRAPITRPPTTRRPTTTSTTTTTTTTKPPTTRPPIVPTQYIEKRVCVAINLWAGNEYLDRWCSDACARGNCPDESCKCSMQRVPVMVKTLPTELLPLVTEPTTTQKPPVVVTTAKVCKAINAFAGNPLFDQWCTDECTKGNCPPTTCTCSDTPMFPMTTTTTTPAPTTPKAVGGPGLTKCVPNGIVGGEYWDAWCQKGCDRGQCAVDYCFCS